MVCHTWRNTDNNLIPKLSKTISLSVYGACNAEGTLSTLSHWFNKTSMRCAAAVTVEGPGCWLKGGGAKGGLGTGSPLIETLLVTFCIQPLVSSTHFSV